MTELIKEPQKVHKPIKGNFFDLDEIIKKRENWYKGIEPVCPYFEMDGYCGLICLYLSRVTTDYPARIARRVWTTKEHALMIITKFWKQMFEVDRECGRGIKYYRLSEAGKKYICDVYKTIKNESLVSKAKHASEEHMPDEEVARYVPFFKRRTQFELLCLYLYNHKGYPYQIERELGFKKRIVDNLIHNKGKSQYFMDLGKHNARQYITLSPEGRAYIEDFIHRIKRGEEG